MIRPVGAGDVPAMLEIYRPYVEGSGVSFEYVLPTPAEFTRRFEEGSEQFPWLVWEEEGRVLGYAYASAPFARAAYRWCAENSLYVAPQAQGRGIGAALERALEDALIRQGYYVLYALITSDNAPSLAFHTAQGFRFLAQFPDCGFKDGVWHSVTWMEKRLRPLSAPPSPPKTTKEEPPC